MTKYILAGGADRKYPEYAAKLRSEIAKTITKPPLVLSCLFAEPREVWEGKFADRQAWFAATFGEGCITQMAFPDTFAEQIREADIIYLHGGDDTLLTHYLEEFDDLATLFSDKIVIGSSAGADYLAKEYWTCDWRQVRTGSGLTDLNIIPHFESPEYGISDPRGPINWATAEAELREAVGSGQKVTLLREGEFVVIET